jgi:hydantoinase/carbamoylase family amidase
MGSDVLISSVKGGRYDGILGVQAGLEVLRTLHENNFQTHSPIALINWTNEEGARFSGAMMSSGVWSQQSFSNLDVCHNTVDIDGIKMGDALEEIGYLGETKCDYRANPISAHFELHIEQGVRLENEKKTVGVVTSVQSMRWHAIRVSGIEGHAGTTPMGVRADALVSACKLITAVRDVAVSTGLGVGTVGVISSDTQSQATIPAGVDFTIDIRCSTDEMVEELYEKVFEKFDEILAEENNGSAWKTVRTWALPESIFDVQCIDSVRSAAVKLVGAGQVLEMKSAAGHDSAWVCYLCFETTRRPC